MEFVKFSTQEFISSSIHPVLIISYEMFLKSHEALHPVRFDLVICDEGHRLKNNGAKTTSVSTNQQSDIQYHVPVQ